MRIPIFIITQLLGIYQLLSKPRSYPNKTNSRPVFYDWSIGIGTAYIGHNNSKIHPDHIFAPQFGTGLNIKFKCADHIEFCFNSLLNQNTDHFNYSGFGSLYRKQFYQNYSVGVIFQFRNEDKKFGIGWRFLCGFEKGQYKFNSSSPELNRILKQPGPNKSLTFGCGPGISCKILKHHYFSFHYLFQRGGFRSSPDSFDPSKKIKIVVPYSMMLQYEWNF